MKTERDYDLNQTAKTEAGLFQLHMDMWEKVNRNYDYKGDDENKKITRDYVY